MMSASELYCVLCKKAVEKLYPFYWGLDYFEERPNICLDCKVRLQTERQQLIGSISMTLGHMSQTDLIRMINFISENMPAFKEVVTHGR